MIPIWFWFDATRGFNEESWYVPYRREGEREGMWEGMGGEYPVGYMGISFRSSGLLRGLPGRRSGWMGAARYWPLGQLGRAAAESVARWRWMPLDRIIIPLDLRHLPRLSGILHRSPSWLIRHRRDSSWDSFDILWGGGFFRVLILLSGFFGHSF